MITKKPLHHTRQAQANGIQSLIKDSPLTQACHVVLMEACRLTPAAFQANEFLVKVQMVDPASLPRLLSMLVLNLSSKERSQLQGLLGILEHTQQ